MFCCLYSEACFQGSAPGKVFSRKKSFKKPSFDLHYLNFNVNETVFNLSEVVTYYVQHLVDKVKKKNQPASFTSVRFKAENGGRDYRNPFYCSFLPLFKVKLLLAVD